MTPPLARVDAHGKVTGTVHYGADRVPPGLAHAALAVATIGRGRIVRIDTAAARAVPGVRLVLTHLDPGEFTAAGYLMAGGYALQSLQPLLDDHVAYRGQPIALVVADTLPAAAEAAALVRAEYEAEPVSAELDSGGADTLEQAAAIPLPMFADVNVGDADCPPQHPVPMELIGCVAEWDGDTLTVHEGTQNAGAVRHGLAAQLGIEAVQVRVISPYVGGAFGNKNSLQPHTSWPLLPPGGWDARSSSCSRGHRCSTAPASGPPADTGPASAPPAAGSSGPPSTRPISRPPATTCSPPATPP